MTIMKNIDLRTRLLPAFVSLHAAVFLTWGVAFLAAPVTLAALLGIELRDATAVADLRAMYGGMSLGVGLFFAAALTRREWMTPALFTIAATSACLLLARIVTMIAHPAPVGLPIYVFAAMEASSLLALLWLRRPVTAMSAVEHAG